MLFAVGLVLAIAQPGDLGGDETAGPAVTTTTSTTLPLATTTTLPADATTSTTLQGSGINNPGQPSGGSDGISETGMESMLGPGLVLLALGLALRGAARSQLD